MFRDLIPPVTIKEVFPTKIQKKDIPATQEKLKMACTRRIKVKMSKVWSLTLQILSLNQK